MKKLIIGRNNNCDIVIPDTTDIVSRKQAVLAISFWGRMILFDTSNNGTYVNGVKLENGKGIRVTRKDRISFANAVEFDWKVVKDPYGKAKLITFLSILVALILTAVAIFFILSEKESKTTTNTTESKEQVIMKEETNTAPEKSVTTHKKSKGKAKKESPKIVKKPEENKPKNDNIPIVF